MSRRKPRRPATADEIQAMIKMRLEEHATWKEIADRFGYAHPYGPYQLVIKAVDDEALLRVVRRVRAYSLTRAFPQGGGYLRRYLPDHPLAPRHGAVLEHRRVLYDAIGPGSHPCSQCGRVLDWSELTVDHINCDRADNRLENLRVCCRGCNAGLQWVRRRVGYPAWMDDPDCPEDFEGFDGVPA